MSISIPGAVFSSLIFHLKNSPSDAEGFLYGSVRTHHVESITDSQSSGTREEKRLYVESFVCFSERFKFYDHYGRPHVERMNVLLREGVKRVVGWFSYRRNTSHRLSMREKVVHRRLTECFSDITSRDFLFGLVTEQVMDGSTVHSTDYSFYNWIGTSLKPVKAEIVNLQVTATVPYQLFPITPTPPSLPHYSSTLQEHRSKFTDADGHMIQAQMSEHLYTAILERLKPLCDSLSEASVAVCQEGREIEELEKQLQKLIHTATEETRETGSEDGDLSHTTGDSTAMLMTSPSTQREQIQVASLIDFDNEPPPVESSSQQNRLVEPVIDLTDTSPDQLLMNGAPPLICLPNDRAGGFSQKNTVSGELCAGEDEREVVEGVERGGVEGGEGREVGGDVDSVSGSQELF